MPYAEIISSLALLISGGSFYLSYLSFRRAGKLEEPNAWIELEPIGTPELPRCWKARIQLRNPTTFALKLDAIRVPIMRVPVDGKQDFMLGNLEAALSECGNDPTKLASVTTGKDIYLKMGLPESLPSITPGMTGSVGALVFQGKLSEATEVEMTLSYWSMETIPRYKMQTMRGRLPSARSIQMEIKRVH